MPYTPTHVIRSIAQVRAAQPQIHPTQTAKVLDHVDALCAAWIARSTFLCMATHGADGAVDVSPKGDPAGFVKVLDPHTLAVPDRPGNHRFDGFENILQTGGIGLIFLVPNRNEVVRVNGTAQIVQDPGLLESLAIKGRVPEFAVLVRVREAFWHCGKAIIRSRLWAPQEAGPIDDLPTYAQALEAHCDIDMHPDQIAARMAYNEQHRLYDE